MTRGRLYVLAAAANLTLIATFAARAARRHEGRLTSPANLLTLARATAAAAPCGTALSGRGRRLALCTLVAACSVLDWLDGPLARRLGPTPLGAVLDIEADSWLTLWAAAAAVRLGGAPAPCLLPPLLRYTRPRRPAPRLRPWQQAAGAAQMVVLAGALTRRPPPPELAVAAALAQLAVLAGSRGAADRWTSLQR